MDEQAPASSLTKESFERLVGPLLRPGLELAFTMLHDQEAARDALQEATLLAWRKRDQLRSPGNVRPWFFAIVANECRALRRTKWWSVVKLAQIANRHTVPEEAIASGNNPGQTAYLVFVGDGAADFPDVPVDANGHFSIHLTVPASYHSLQGQGGGAVTPGQYVFRSQPPVCVARFTLTP